MRGRDLRRVERDLAVRRAPTREAAAERAHRGAELVRAALRGESVPDVPVEPAAPPTPARARAEWVSCSRCYAPHDGPPGTPCPDCRAREPQDLTDLDGGDVPTPPPRR